MTDFSAGASPSPAMPPWHDPSPPHITAEMLLAHRCERDGVTPESLALPPVLVATFQGASYQHLAARTGVAPPAARHDGTAIVGSLDIGKIPDSGRPVAVSRLPAGAPTATLVLESAFVRGVRVVLVVGSAGSLRSDVPLGSTVVVTEAAREEGTSHHYLPADVPTCADAEIGNLLMRSAAACGVNPVRGPTWTTDAPLRETAGAVKRHQAAGVTVVEMEASAIFAVAQVRGVRAGVLVAVSDELFVPWRPGFHDEAYLTALTRGIDAALLAAEHLTSQE
ncbi:MAG: hypothetical protein CL878_07875 [Dehalococcoidia bacterium]|nr:hypothetical protein [Dehalococcoidia bacterium]